MQETCARSGSGAPPEPAPNLDPVRRTAERERQTGDGSPSMHEGVEVWCDCCSCEAEPYWVAVAAELGIDPD